MADGMKVTRASPICSAEWPAQSLGDPLQCCAALSHRTLPTFEKGFTVSYAGNGTGGWNRPRSRRCRERLFHSATTPRNTPCLANRRKDAIRASAFDTRLRTLGLSAEGKESNRAAPTK